MTQNSNSLKSTQQPEPRKFTPIDELSEKYMAELAKLYPVMATMAGITGYDHLLSNYDPDSQMQSAEIIKSVLREVEALAPKDKCDEITKAVLQERLGIELELHDSKEYLAPVNVISSPIQEVRDVFDLMPTQTESDFEVVVERMRQVPQSIASYEVALHAGTKTGPRPAIRQVEQCIKQALNVASVDDSPFTAIARDAAENDNIPVTLLSEFLDASTKAREAYRHLAQTLKDVVAPNSITEDGVGRERYELLSRSFLGTKVDLEETYNWGAEIIEETISEQKEIARELYGEGTGIREALDNLNQDERYIVRGTDSLQRWMQEKANGAIDALQGKYFDIPAEISQVDCKIAPSGSGGIYYVGPSEDFTRKGAMWWSVPKGTNEFSTWSEITTVYHEGVPGHHLQIGITTYNRAQLNSFRRLGCWVSGYGEGWALYAERLMDELGFLGTPAERMGMIDAQHLRAARVVIDIGIHLGLEMHPSYGEGKWNEPKAWNFLREHLAMDPAFLRFELDRYLGFAGQAPSYKIGQRLWEQSRTEAETRAKQRGEKFDLKQWHMDILKQGNLPLSLIHMVTN